MFSHVHISAPIIPWRPVTRLAIILGLCLAFWLLLWWGLVGAACLLPGSVNSFVKIAHNTNGGPALADADSFGSSVSHIGDLNRDGIPDLVVGPANDDTGGSERGALYTLLMNSDGTVGSSVKIAHNLNGGPTLADGDNFGSSATGIGDLNRDGIPDLAVGAFGDDTGGTARGALYILLMNSNGTVSSRVKIAHNTNGGPTLADFDNFGVSVAGIGDLNRDGIPDLAVGANGDILVKVINYDFDKLT